MLQSLDGAAVRRWAATCCDVLAAHRDEIDALNVFPVPDQDTGSNLLATMRAGLDAVLRDQSQDRDLPPGSTVAVLARGALLGARGNSGVILSQVLRGLAEPLIGDDAESAAPTWDGASLREGLRRADELAMAAVSEPVSGTVLTVLHAAALAATACRSEELAEVASAATAAAAGALADTPRQLAALATAGVVDAGGRGLILLLEALLAVVTERPCGWPATATEGCARPAHARWVARDGGSPDYEYEVMYLLEGADDAGICTLRAELARLGDCVAIVGTGRDWDREAAPVWHVHVHCADVGAAIEAGVRAGRPHRITVLRFADQVTGQVTAQKPLSTGHAVLALVTGSGVAELCRREGVVTVPATSSVAELAGALAATRAPQVTVLAEPSAASTAQIAADQARATGQQVVVVPARSAVQILAAVAVHDGARHPAQDRVAMTDAVTATRCGELSVSNRDPLAAADELVARMLSAGGELVTVLLGWDAPDGFADALTERLGAAHPGVELVIYPGDVPERVLLVGVE